MNAVFAILSVQALIGAFDNLWHHELEAKLPQRVSARYELTLHAAREAIYGVLFLGLAWTRWEGAWAWVLAALLAVEIVITLADFIEEDLTRRLPALERVLHTILAVSYGAFVAALAPVMMAWAKRPSAMPMSGHGWVSWLFTLYAAGVFAWSVRNWIAVVRLNRAARSVAADTGTAPASGPAVLVTGATGFIGSALVRNLLADGHRVIALTRDARRAALCLGRRVQVIENLDALASETPVASIVNLAGASILGGRWSQRRKTVLLASRVEVTRDVCALIERLDHRPEVLVSASAAGFYGVREPGVELDETAPAQPGCFQSDLCAAWERAAVAASALGVRVVRLRLGVVLGRAGGLFPALALVARLGAAAVLGSGRQPAPWIHIDDALGLIRFAIERRSLAGPVNAVAPERVCQAEFISRIAGAVGSRPRLRVPTRLLKMLAGEAAELLLEGQSTTPSQALAAGYRFSYPWLETAAEELAQSRGFASPALPGTSGLAQPHHRRRRPALTTRGAA